MRLHFDHMCYSEKLIHFSLVKLCSFLHIHKHSHNRYFWKSWDAMRNHLIMQMSFDRAVVFTKKWFPSQKAQIAARYFIAILCSFLLNELFLCHVNLLKQKCLNNKKTRKEEKKDLMTILPGSWQSEAEIKLRALLLHKLEFNHIELSAWNSSMLIIIKIFSV